MNYIWQKNRLIVMLPNGSYLPDAIPYKIKKSIIINYLYNDVVRFHYRLFVPERQLKNEEFIYRCCIGLIPRFYDATCQDDRILLREDCEVAEIVFIMTGHIGIGFAHLTYRP